MNDENKMDKARYESSINKLQKIYQTISDSATDISKRRCPYKNVKDRCTAKFGCRNQDRDVAESELFICLGSDKLNYQSAWNLQESI